jgi:hypothetical protein
LARADGVELVTSPYRSVPSMDRSPDWDVKLPVPDGDPRDSVLRLVVESRAMEQDDQHILLQIMESVSFGQDAAENEDNLPEVFVAGTEVYSRMLRDEIDVVTGCKGSGKSAIYRMITETVLSDDLHVLPAVNPTGSPVFRHLFTEESSEARIRGVWTAYITSLVGNWVVDTYANTSSVAHAVEEVGEFLVLLGLKRPPQGRRESLIDRIREARLGNGIAGVGSASADLTFDLPDAIGTPTTVVLEPQDFFLVIQKCADVLTAVGTRLWVAFDRLDECFNRVSGNESAALRALLRTHLDMAQALAYSRTIRVKIFLRSDLLSRMSRDAAFTNSTHIRQADLRWNSPAIAHMIAVRASQSELFSERYLTGPDREVVADTWKALLPDLSRSARNGRVSITTAHRVCGRTADGSSNFSPRNVISLMNMAIARARDNQRREIELNRAARAFAPLIKESELHSAEGDLSRKRLQDSVINEFPLAAKFVPKLEGGPVRFESTAALMHGIESGSTDRESAERIADELLFSGVIGKEGHGWSIPFLYRAALKPYLKLPRVRT